LPHSAARLASATVNSSDASGWPTRLTVTR
jgi:hypothetical protein